MKFELLPGELQAIIKQNGGKQYSNTLQTIYVFNQRDYENIFWAIFSKPHRDSNGKIVSSQRATELVHLLNEYIAAKPSPKMDDIKLKNPIKIKRPKPPLREIQQDALRQLDSFDKIFRSALNPIRHLSFEKTEQKSIELTARFFLGQLIYSAIRFAGLLRVDLISSLFRKLTDGKPFYKNGICWFELTGAENEFHVWIPGPVTLALLPRFLKFKETYLHHLQEFLKTTNWRLCLDSFLKEAGDKYLYKNSNKKLISLIIAKLSLTHSACHLSALDGSQPNLTLGRNSFYRLLGFYEEMENSPNLTEDFEIPLENREKSPSLVNIHSAYTDCALYIKKVKVILRDLAKNSQENTSLSAKKKAAKEITEISEDKNATLLPITRLVIAWTGFRLTSKISWSGTKTPQSLEKALGAAFVSLTRIFHATLILELDTETLDEYYLEFIDEATTLNSGLSRARFIRDIHEFLVNKYKIPASYVATSVIAHNAKRTAHMVDANILMPGEYYSAIHFMYQNIRTLDSRHKYLRLAQIALLIIGFRCGLRRNEIYFLKITDFHYLEEGLITERTELEIKFSSERKLKTPSAIRRIPIGIFLIEPELKILNFYFSARVKNNAGEYLFSEPFLDTQYSKEQLFTPIISLLKQITRDNSFRFHRLRHSFVTWMFWHWQCHKFSFNFPLKKHINHEFMAHLHHAKQVYFSSKNDANIRSELHAISLITGHSGPSITTFHYLHSLQWTYAAEFWRDKELSDAAIYTLLNVPKRTYYDKIKKNGFETFILNSIEHYCSPPPLTSNKPAIENYFMEKELISKNQTEIIFYKNLMDYNKEFIVPLVKGEISDIENPVEWAEHRNLEIDKFENAVNLLAELTDKKQRNSPGAIIADNFSLKKENVIRTENYGETASAPYLKLRRYPKHIFAQNTLEHVLEIFRTLSEDEKQEVLKACHWTITKSTNDWNSQLFWEPKKLWNYLNWLYPIISKLSKKRDFELKIRAKIPTESAVWQGTKSVWSTPTFLSGMIKSEFVEYQDTGLDGYALFSLKRLEYENHKHKVGDHGFFVALFVIYFYYGRTNFDIKNLIPENYIHWE